MRNVSALLGVSHCRSSEVILNNLTLNLIIYSFKELYASNSASVFLTASLLSNISPLSC